MAVVEVIKAKWPKAKTTDEIFSGMESIIKRDMLIKGKYATKVVNEDLLDEGAMCGGRQVCLLGTAWSSYGADLEVNAPYEGMMGTDFFFEGVMEEDRPDYLANNPVLKAAYDAMNEVARDWIDKGLVFDETMSELMRDDYRYDLRNYRSKAEAMFETFYELTLDQQDLLRFVGEARERARLAAV